jgi:hypothetical protein
MIKTSLPPSYCHCCHHHAKSLPQQFRCRHHRCQRQAAATTPMLPPPLPCCRPHRQAATTIATATATATAAKLPPGMCRRQVGTANAPLPPLPSRCCTVATKAATAALVTPLPNCRCCTAATAAPPSSCRHRCHRHQKDIYSKTIPHKNLCNMHVALRNMHIVQVSTISRPTHVTLTQTWLIIQAHLWNYFVWYIHRTSHLMTQKKNETQAVCWGIFVWVSDGI